jgi:hypothetical protein
MFLKPLHKIQISSQKTGPCTASEGESVFCKPMNTDFRHSQAITGDGQEQKIPHIAIARNIGQLQTPVLQSQVISF